jgi:hypothetical protein
MKLEEETVVYRQEDGYILADLLMKVPIDIPCKSECKLQI